MRSVNSEEEKDEFPPVWDRLVEMFGVRKENTVVTYGDKIYSERELTYDIIVHEEVHQKQQRAYGVEEWWDKYLEDVVFRRSQEVEAYQKQYQYLKRVIKNREKLNNNRVRLARDLSSSQYGEMMTYQEALKMIA